MDDKQILFEQVFKDFEAYAQLRSEIDHDGIENAKSPQEYLILLSNDFADRRKRTV
jgi:hypothetical protein